MSGDIPEFRPKSIGEGGESGYDAVLGSPEANQAGDAEERADEARKAASLPAAWESGSVAAVNDTEERGFPANVDANGDYRIDTDQQVENRPQLKPGDIGYIPELDDPSNQ